MTSSEPGRSEEASTPIGDVLDASRPADEPLRGFTGTMVGITCQDAFRRTVAAEFDWFRLEQ
jgi:beta-xylosidase